MDLSTPRLFLPLLFGVLFPTTLIADQPWVLRTEWKCESGTQDPTLEYFKTKEQLLKEIESTRRKYSSDGILKSAPCKPSRFTYWYDNGNTTTKPPKDAVTLEANPSPSSSTSSTTPKPGTAEKTKSTGKGKWVMWLEKMEEGKWSEVTGRRYEYLESEGMTEDKFKEKLKTYENAVESENKKVIQKETEQQTKGQTVKPIRFRVRWTLEEAGLGKSSSTEDLDLRTVLSKISGEWIEDKRYQMGKVQIYQINGDGTYKSYFLEDGGTSSAPYQVGQIIELSDNKNGGYWLYNKYKTPKYTGESVTDGSFFFDPKTSGLRSGEKSAPFIRNR
jgi:hypothetical protein